MTSTATIEVSSWRTLDEHGEVKPEFDMERVVQLSKAGKKGAALDAVFEQMNHLLQMGRFDECAHVLLLVEPAKLLPSVAAGFLAITAPSSELRLPRASLASRIRRTYQNSMAAEKLNALLNGFE